MSNTAKYFLGTCSALGDFRIHFAEAGNPATKTVIWDISEAEPSCTLQPQANKACNKVKGDCCNGSNIEVVDSKGRGFFSVLEKDIADVASCDS